MISSFKVKNFLSFRDEQTISFEATNDHSNEDYYCVEVKDGVRLLKTAIIYGANASGKTNLLEAFDFLREILLESPKDKNERIGIQPFLLDDYSKDEKSYFMLTFYIEDVKYIYDITLDTKRIYSEQLVYYPKIQPAKLYNRLYNNESDSSEIEFGTHLKLGKKDRLIITGNTLNNTTVLAAFTKSNVATSVLNDVFSYFSSGIKDLLRPNTILSAYIMKELEDYPEMKDFVISLLKQSDFNICGLDIEKEEIVLTPEMETIINIPTFPEDLRKHYLEKRVVERKDLVYAHNTKHGIYSLSEDAESRGTRRYTGMATILYHLIRKNTILFVDELESSLHFDLLSYFIKLFLANGEKRSQLIFTTHDINLLDEDFIRRDAVWFSDKNEDGETDIYRLSDRGLHKNLSPYNAYRQGKLGAKPFFGNIFID